MQESMMIADVGGIVNVSGSRIATPFAPPNPGSTPMMTASTMPTIIKSRLNGERTTTKPWNRAFNSANELSSSRTLARGPRDDGFSVSEERERVPDAFVERHLEPDLEQHEDRRAREHAYEHAS